MRKKYGIKIETLNSAGRYSHKVSDIGSSFYTKGQISDSVVEALKKINEQVWEEMPDGSGGLVAIIKYKGPKKKR